MVTLLRVANAGAVSGNVEGNVYVNSERLLVYVSSPSMFSASRIPVDAAVFFNTTVLCDLIES